MKIYILKREWYDNWFENDCEVTLGVFSSMEEAKKVIPSYFTDQKFTSVLCFRCPEGETLDDGHTLDVSYCIYEYDLNTLYKMDKQYAHDNYGIDEIFEGEMFMNN